MKTIAFAGHSNILKSLVKKYTGQKFTLDTMSHQLATGEQVKILVSKDAYDAEGNPYQWATNADHVFVCVDADDSHFFRHCDEELRENRFEKDKIILVLHSDILNEEVFNQICEYGLHSGFPVIYCSTHAVQARYAQNGSISELTFKAIFDGAISDTLDVDFNVEESESSEEVPDNKRRRCSVM